MSSKWRVLWPEDAWKVLPCIGSQTHTTGRPLSLTARTRGGSSSSTLLAPSRLMSTSRPGTRSGSRRSHSSRTSSGSLDGPSLIPDRVADAGQEGDVGAVELAGAVADPQEVGGAVVPAAAEGVAARERFLVAEDECLVARPEVDLVDGLGFRQVDAAGGHEPQRPVDLGRDLLVAQSLGAGGHELLVPHVDLAQVGEAALGERPQQVHGGRRLVVGGQQAGRVGHPGGGRGQRVVDHVAAERRDDRVADGLGGRRAGLGELPGDPAHLHHRHAGAVGQHDRHLQDDLELVADGVGGEPVERLGAVAGLEQERLAGGHLGERLA